MQWWPTRPLHPLIPTLELLVGWNRLQPSSSLFKLFELQREVPLGPELFFAQMREKSTGSLNSNIDGDSSLTKNWVFFLWPWALKINLRKMDWKYLTLEIPTIVLVGYKNAETSAKFMKGKLMMKSSHLKKGHSFNTSIEKARESREEDHIETA